MHQHGPKYFDCSPPPMTLGMGSIGQSSSFFRTWVIVTYQIKGITKCSNTVANILPADPLPPSPGDWVSRSNSTFSEHIKLRKRIANAATR